MFKKFLLLVFLFLLTSLGFLFSSPVLAHDETIVEVTESGFIPDIVEMHVGDTLTFKNVGTDPVWPASDIHPTHAIYPEFDPLKAFPAGASWSFTFDKAGVWQFHDHNHPNSIGKVTVLGETTVVEQEKEELPKLSLKERVKIFATKTYLKFYPKGLEKVMSKVDMYSAAKDDGQIQYWVKAVGAKETLLDLVRDTNGGNLYDCHQEAHKMGRVAYIVLGSSVFGEGDSSCHSGFYHGAMEAFLKEKGTLNLGEKIKTICKSFPSSFGEFECLHGVGHGVMAYLRYDLPEAIKLCDQLETPYDQSSCYGGMFMENIVTALGLGAIPGHVTKWLNADPHFPCNAVSQDDSLQFQCYLIQTARMMQLFQNDYGKIAEACLTSPEKMISTCFQSLGRDLAGAVLRDPDRILATCSSVSGEYFDSCVRGALYVTIEFWGERVGAQPYQLCAKIQDKNSKQNCYGASFGRLNDIFTNDQEARRRSCEYVEAEYRPSCQLYI